MKIFVICQVQKADKEEVERQKLHVEFYERLGHEVYWPARDTNQMDPTGLAICETNFRNMQKADLVHVMWTDSSEGTRFDLGMAFAMGKPIIPFYTTPPYLGKSFPAMILHYFDKYGFVGAGLPRLGEVLRANHQQTQILPDAEKPKCPDNPEPNYWVHKEINEYLEPHGIKAKITAHGSDDGATLLISTDMRLGSGEQEHIKHIAKGYKVQFRVMPDEEVHELVGPNTKVSIDPRLRD